MPEKRPLFSSLTEWLGTEENGLRNNYWSRNLEIEQFLALNFLKVGTAWWSLARLKKHLWFVIVVQYY